MQLFSSAVIGCAADVAIDAFNTPELNLLFLRAGLGDHAPGTAWSKSVLVNTGVTSALREKDEPSVKDGLNELVRLVAERVAPKEANAEVKPGSPYWRLREAVRSDGFDLRVQHSSDGRPAVVRVLPLDEPEAPLSKQITALEEQFTELGLTVALNHYRQAVKSFVGQDFEAANSQLRTMFEAVITHFAVGVGFTQTKAGEGGNAINYLITNGHLPERDGGGFVQGLWRIVQTNGPHPGTTTAGEVHFRMLTLTGAARYLIDRFSPPAAP